MSNRRISKGQKDMEKKMTRRKRPGTAACVHSPIMDNSYPVCAQEYTGILFAGGGTD